MHVLHADIQPYIYIYIYAYIHACMHACLPTYLPTYLLTNKRTLVGPPTCIPCKYKQSHAHPPCRYTYTYVSIHICIYIYIPTHIRPSFPNLDPSRSAHHHKDMPGGRAPNPARRALRWRSSHSLWSSFLLQPKSAM